METQKTQKNTEPVILIKGLCRGRNWCYTLNNYDETETQKHKDFIVQKCIKGGFQTEIGKEGTPHLQGLLLFKNAKTNIQIKKHLGEKIHLEICKNINASINYITKSDTFDGKCRFTHNIEKIDEPIIDFLENKTLYPWQEEVKKLLAKAPDARTVHWIFDHEGNNGKTSFLRHLCLNNKNYLYLDTAKNKDVKYIFSEVKNIKAVFFNFSRQLQELINYGTFENLLDGILTTTKYESKTIIFNPPHIFILANFEPNKHNLSIDRWKIYSIIEKNLSQQEL